MKLNQLVTGLLMAATAAFSTGAQAYTVNNVTWDQTSLADFSMQATLYENSIGAIGDILTGIGQITAINGNQNFCNGCQLTYQFGGFEVTDMTPSVYNPVTKKTSLGDVAFTGGWLKMWVDSSTSFDFENKSTANDGTLWLDMKAVDASGDNSGITLEGWFRQTLANGISGFGEGLFDIVGGTAMPYLDSNQQTGGRDLSYTTSFQTFPSKQTTSDGYQIFGTPDIAGMSTDLPEPASLALMGLGLLGFASANRRQRRSA